MDDHISYSATSTPKATENETFSTIDLNTEYSYKLNEEAIRLLIRYRATNAGLFTGRRDSSRLAWRMILKEMGLQRKISYSQIRKKWENLTRKYKTLKSLGPEASHGWQLYKMMEDAIEGRIFDSSLVISVDNADGDDDDDYLPCKPRVKRPCQDNSTSTLFFETRTGEAVTSSAASISVPTVHGDEIEFLVNSNDSAWPPEGNSSGVGAEADSDRHEIEQERAQLDSDRMLVEKEREILERERMVLEREHTGLQRELASLDRDRATLERERAALERERAAVDWERAKLEKERAQLEREKLNVGFDSLARRGCSTKTASAVSNGAPDPEAAGNTTEPDLDPEGLERRQKFLNLFENLLENF